jgi:hypothetical protein
LLERFKVWGHGLIGPKGVIYFSFSILLLLLLFCFVMGKSSFASSLKPRPTTTEAIKQAVAEEWDALTIDDYEQMILSMPERIRECLPNEGGHTR